MRTPRHMLFVITALFAGILLALTVPAWLGTPNQAAAALQSDFDVPPGLSAQPAPAERNPMQPPSIPAGEAGAAVLLPAAPQPGQLAAQNQPAGENAEPGPSETDNPSKVGSVFTVVNTNNSGAGSLREAVSQAVASAGSDTIQFNLAGCPCSITLLSELVVPGSDALRIVGPGSSLLTLSGNLTNRILATSAAPLRVSGLTLANGFPASGNGGTINAASLSLQDVIVRDSAAAVGGGVYASGALVITDTQFLANTSITGSGGGVYANATLTASNATFQNNSAYADGGGAYVSGNATILGGSFTANQTSEVKGYGGGGGLMAFGVTTLAGTQFTGNTTPAWGGGAYLANFGAGTVNHLANATFSGNQANYGGGGLFQWFNAMILATNFLNNQSGTSGGGLYAGYAGNYDITLTGGRIEGNRAAVGGGLFSDGAFSLQSVEVYSNTATSGRGGGAYASTNANVSGSGFTYNTVITAGNGGGLFVQINAAITDTIFLQNQVLGSASGGGLAVGISSIQPGSANLLRVTFDGNSNQKGFGGGLLSYGPTRLTDSTFSDNVSWNDGGGAWVGGELTLQGGLFESNQTLLNEYNGGGGGLMSIGPVSINDTQFVTNLTADWGGGAYIYNGSGTASTLTSIVALSNTAVNGGGGGIFSWFATNLSGSQFQTNTAAYRGGGLYAGYNGNYPIRVYGGSFLNNSGSGGGGLYSDSNFWLDGATFSGNVARNGNGGGAWTVRSARVTGSTFSGNQVLAGGNSGGIDALASLWLTDTLLANNHNLCCAAGGSGSGGNTTVVGGEYRQNQAAQNGGGLLAYGKVSLDGTRFYTNTAGGLGGGVVTNYISALSAIFQDNSADFGGGVFAQYSYTLTNSTFSGNQALTNGGGLFQQAAPGSGQINQSVFRDNTAGSLGGGLALNANSIALNQTLLLGNQAVAGGGLALQGTAGGSLQNVLMARNQALGGSGNAIHMDTSGALSLQYATLANPSLVAGSAIYLNAGSLSVENSILARSAVGLSRIAGTADLTNPLFFGNTSNTQGSGITVNSPVSGDPVFFDPVSDDYHLSAGSQAFNAGAAVSAGSDIDGDPRPQGGGYDIGYDEAITPSGVSLQSDAPKLVNLPVAFSGQAAFGQGVEYSWDFGDGQTGVGATITHTYTQPGVYQVTLTAANAAGQNLATANVSITAIQVFLPLIRN